MTSKKTRSTVQLYKRVPDINLSIRSEIKRGFLQHIAFREIREISRRKLGCLSWDSIAGECDLMDGAIKL